MPEKRFPHIQDDEWWTLLPGEEFTDTRGDIVRNDGSDGIPMRVHIVGELDDEGLWIQVCGGNFFIDGASDIVKMVRNVPRNKGKS